MPQAALGPGGAEGPKDGGHRGRKRRHRPAQAGGDGAFGAAQALAERGDQALLTAVMAVDELRLAKGPGALSAKMLSAVLTALQEVLGERGNRFHAVLTGYLPNCDCSAG